MPQEEYASRNGGTYQRNSERNRSAAIPFWRQLGRLQRDDPGAVGGPADAGMLLEEEDVEAGFGAPGRGEQSREPCADDGDVDHRGIAGEPRPSPKVPARTTRSGARSGVHGSWLRNRIATLEQEHDQASPRLPKICERLLRRRPGPERPDDRSNSGWRATY